MVNQKGNFNSHTKLCGKLLSGVLSDREQDQQTTTLNIDTSFGTEIPILSECIETEPNTDTILCYADSSKMNDKVGAGVYIPEMDGRREWIANRNVVPYWSKLNRFSSRNVCR